MHRVFSYLLKSANILNMLLLLTAFLTGYMVFSPIIHARIKFPLPKTKAALPDGSWNVQDVQYPPLADFAKIPDQNLFHPDRIIPVEKASVPIPVPELILYGTLITGDVSVAYVEDKKAPPLHAQSRGERQTSFKKGQSISGFVLKEIEADSIVLYRGKEKLVVKLDGSQKKRSADNATIAAAAQQKVQSTPSPSPGGGLQEIPQMRGPGSWMLNK